MCKVNNQAKRRKFITIITAAPSMKKQQNETAAITLPHHPEDISNDSPEMLMKTKALVARKQF